MKNASTAPKNREKSAPAGFQSRAAATEALFQTLRKGRAFDLAFDDAAQKLPDRDRAFARTLVLTVLRRRGSLGALLRRLSSSPIKPNAFQVELVLLVGLAQILILDTDAHAAANIAVEQVKRGPRSLRFLDKMANAILRRAAREKEFFQSRLDAKPLLDLPKGLRERWVDQYGTDTARKLSIALRSLPATDLSFKPGEDMEKWAEELAADPLPTGSLRVAPGPVTGLAGFDAGTWWVQDAAAAIPAKLLGDIQGKRVLDMCAAPGGKTLQLSAAGAMVTALDRSDKRLQTLKSNLKRTNMDAEIVCSDALKYEPDQQFDMILLDAPCSATGTYRRNPDGLWIKSADDIQKLANLQKRMLDQATALLKPGGTLVYCVCSMEWDEGENQWQDYLNRTPAVSASPINENEVGGLSEIINEQGCLRTHPGLESVSGGLDGFFIARAVKAG